MTTEATSRSMNFIAPDQQQENSSGLLFAWRRKWIVVLIGLIGLSFGYLYFLNEVPLYESIAQVLVIQQQAIKIQGLDMMMPTEYDNTHEILIRSPEVAVRAVTTLKENSARLSGREYTLMDIVNGLAVNRASRDRNSGDVYEIRFKSKSASDSQEVLFAVVKAYEDFLATTYQNVGISASKLIEKARNDVEKQITEAQKVYDDFKSGQNKLVYAGTATLNLHEPHLNQIEEERTKVTSEKYQVNSPA